jgi:hypothetical protein
MKIKKKEENLKSRNRSIYNDSNLDCNPPLVTKSNTRVTKASFNDTQLSYINEYLNKFDKKCEFCYREFQNIRGLKIHLWTCFINNLSPMTKHQMIFSITIFITC